MPKLSFPATAEGLPTFDRSRIMKTAWAICRRDNTYGGKFCYSRERFAKALRKAWFEARQATGRLSETETRNATRADAIRAEIDALQFKSLRYDIGAMRLRLTAELMAITGGSA